MIFIIFLPLSYINNSIRKIICQINIKNKNTLKKERVNAYYTINLLIN